MTMKHTPRIRGVAAVLAAGAALLAGSGSAAAQSLFASRGLGYVNPPVDGRARGLGGAGLALPGGGLSLVNPAAIAAIPVSAISMAFQPDFYDASIPGQGTDGSTARFPLLHAVFPFGQRWTFSAGYGSYLDQTWAAESSSDLVLPGREVEVTDRYVSRGGVARLRAGAAYSITDRLSVGVAGDLYAGGVRDTVTRTFRTPEGTLGLDLSPTAHAAEWTYRSLGGSVGVRWVPIDALNLAAAVTAAGKLEGRPSGGTDSAAVSKEFSLPLTFDVGASGRVTPGALVVLNGQWAGWSAADADLAGAGGARDAWTVAGGVEFGPAALDARSFPLRVGARYSALPFRWGPVSEGGAFPNEKALTAGIGARLANGAALVDLGGERGWRGGGDSVLDESYWRMTLSLTLLGR